jgi:transposase
MDRRANQQTNRWHIRLQNPLAVQDRRMATPFSSQVEREKLPLDKDWKKDLEAHSPVEVLADREASSVARWLRTHPGVKLISRDRAGAYAEGAKRGAPRAKQVADRFHLLVNLREAIQDSLTRHQDRLPMIAGERAEPPPSSPERAGAPASGTSPRAKSPQERAHDERGGPEPAAEHGRILTAAERRRQVSRTNRLARYEQVVTLSHQGFSERAIARQMHISRQVVHRFVSAGRFPERAQAGKRQSKLDPFLPTLRHRWEQGCRNGLQLAREIQAQGYSGSASLVCHVIGDWRANSPRPPKRERGRERQAAPPVRRRLSPRQASWLFVKEHEQLTADQVVLIERVCQADADLHQLYQLGQDFVTMVKQRQSKRLAPWLARAQRSACVELQGFAFGIKRDYAAVKAGLSLPWNQGQLEGQITRLKLLKRQMYGRARFDLLRLRVLSRA